ncbi:MAG: alpha/beta fold hydrolase [Anaerolineales bacterium]|nr:alpha/beta fold hydrolase [Anaerolineales bacterium]
MTYPISRYLNTTKAYYPSFSSDGQRLAFISDITGIPQAWQVSLNPDLDQPPWPDQLTFETDRVMALAFSPAPGDGRMIISRDVGGDENAQLFLLTEDASQEIPLTIGHEGSMHIFGEWLADGDGIIFAANRRHPGLFDLYLQPLNGEARMIWKNDVPGYLYAMSLSPDGEHAVLTRMSSSFEHDLFLVNLDAGEACQLNPPGEIARYFAIFASNGKELYVNTDLGSDFLYISRLNLGTLDFEPMVSLDWDTHFITLSPDGEHLAHTVNVNGGSEVHVLDITSGEQRSTSLPQDDPGVVAMWDLQMAFSPESDRLAFSFTTATRTSDIYIWDLASNRLQALTRSSHGGIPRDAFFAPELVHYPTFDDQKIPAWLFHPSTTDEQVPVIVFVHGGPESQFRPYFHFFIQYFLDQGYAVFAPNVRGSTGHGKVYSHLDDVEKRMDSVTDLAYAAMWLGEQPGLDGSRLVVYGGSYGGFMVLASLAYFPDLWAAGVDIVGISNLVTFLENTSEYRRGHREAEYGSLERDREFLESIAPINHVEKIKAPLMVIHGANDPRVPLSEAEQLVSALEKQGVPVRFLVFDDEGHGLVRLKNKLIAYPAIVDFLEAHL